MDKLEISLAIGILNEFAVEHIQSVVTIFGYSELNNSKVSRFGSSKDVSTAEGCRYHLSVDSSSLPWIVLTYPSDEVSEGSGQLG